MSNSKILFSVFFLTVANVTASYADVAANDSETANLRTQFKSAHIPAAGEIKDKTKMICTMHVSISVDYYPPNYAELYDNFAKVGDIYQQEDMNLALTNNGLQLGVAAQ